MSQKMILPPRLKNGQKIGVIAPADPVAGMCSEEDIKRGYEYLEKKGFSVVVGDSVKDVAKKHVAGSIELRVNDFHNFLKNNDIGCIMAFWGGFNSNQLLDYLDYDLIKANPKIIIGYSDITALTTAITTKTGLITFSGPGVVSFLKPEPFEYTWNYFEKMCINPTDKLRVESSPEYADDLFFLREDNDHRIKKTNEGIKTFVFGKAQGEVIAGNLQTILVLNGTEYLPDVRGKILFVEEDETSTPAHVDRYLAQCKQLGWFDNIAGLIFGRFTEQSSFSKEDSFEDLLRQYLSDVNFPVMYNVDFGHSDPIITIPNGGIVSVDAVKKEIIFDQAVL
ncbi:MAG: LD-carboxypeptidase [Candidatus Moranbacteria bacterium]|nr:LD-carboxypeptidase [Candidatus Moranbacteria bacterium]